MRAYLKENPQVAAILEQQIRTELLTNKATAPSNVMEEAFEAMDD